MKENERWKKCWMGLQKLLDDIMAMGLCSCSHLIHGNEEMVHSFVHWKRWLHLFFLPHTLSTYVLKQTGRNLSLYGKWAWSFLGKKIHFTKVWQLQWWDCFYSHKKINVVCIYTILFYKYKGSLYSKMQQEITSKLWLL